jgi:hypothetical protein
MESAGELSATNLFHVASLGTIVSGGAQAAVSRSPQSWRPMAREWC